MKVAINGLGRIGRLVLKSGLDEGVNFVAINDLTDPRTLAYLIKYDSVYGKYDKEVEAGKDFIKIGGKKIMILSERDPGALPWKKLGIDVVIESTGFFTDKEGASKHLNAGAKRVIISAPAKNPDITVVLGVNDNLLKSSHKIISMASCTTNGLTPVAKVLEEEFGIVKGFMTTAHAYTSDQDLVDAPHKNLRRGRAAAINIVPTTSGATSAVAEVIPSLKGKLVGLALRVPVPSGSIVDFVAELKKEVTVEQVNNAFKKAASLGRLKGILKYTEDEIVSSDIIGEKHSSIVDGLSTMVIGNTVKVLAWYDNEFGYAHRLAEFIKKLG
ncbi:MAG: type I glyceraldehyde-3-phosphate dehydrogenase [Candidatus Nanoarchaeia archaeon]